MPLTLTDQDLAELNNEIMGEMRGKELRLLANFLQVKINRQQQEQEKAAAPVAPPVVEPPMANGHANEDQPSAP